MGISLGWERFVGPKGKMLAIDTFGASGTGADVMEAVWIYRLENVVATSKSNC